MNGTTNLGEVAAKAKVSLSTASRVFSGAANVSPDVRQRVLDASHKLGYAPKLRPAKARGANGHERTLDTVVLSTCAPARAELSSRLGGFYGFLLHAMEEECRERDITLVFMNCGWDEECVERLRNMANHGMGVILVGPFGETEILGARAAGLPTVLLNNVSEQPVDAIVPDYYRGAHLAVRHLVANGHRRIAYLHGQDRYTTRQRLTAYRDVLAESGIRYEPGLVVACDQVVLSAREAVTQLLRKRRDFTAMMCVNDMAAVGAMQAFGEVGLRPGKEISVVGFDDLDISSYTDVQLTTVHSPISDLCKVALRRLQERAVKFPDEPTQRIVLDVRLVERQTVRRLSDENKPVRSRAS